MRAATITQPVPPVAVPQRPVWATEDMVTVPGVEGDTWQFYTRADRDTGVVDSSGNRVWATVSEIFHLVEGRWVAEPDAPLVEVPAFDLTPEQLRRLGQAMVALADELTGGAA